VEIADSDHITVAFTSRGVDAYLSQLDGPAVGFLDTTVDRTRAIHSAAILSDVSSMQAVWQQLGMSHQGVPAQSRR
jgi:N-formylglutamate amidohydrolase